MKLVDQIINESFENINKSLKDRKNPILMYDAGGTVITTCNPSKSLKDKDEIAMYTLSALKSYTSDNEAILWKTIHELGLYDVAQNHFNALQKEGYNKIVTFYKMVDEMTDEFCKKINDNDQELRIAILLKMHKLVDAEIFDVMSAYSLDTFDTDVKQILLTQDNSIMKKVYEEMLKAYDVEVMTIPDSRFDGLRKDNPELYTKIAEYYNRVPNSIGLYDDGESNLNAAEQAGMLTQIATGIKMDDIYVARAEAKNLVRRLFN